MSTLGPSSSLEELELDLLCFLCLLSFSFFLLSFLSLFFFLCLLSFSFFFFLSFFSCFRSFFSCFSDPILLQGWKGAKGKKFSQTSANRYSPMQNTVFTRCTQNAHVVPGSTARKSWKVM